VTELLVKHPELNNRIGTIVSFDDVELRWLVRLDEGRSVSVKSENLRRATDNEASSSSQSVADVPQIQALPALTGHALDTAYKEALAKQVHDINECARDEIEAGRKAYVEALNERIEQERISHLTSGKERRPDAYLDILLNVDPTNYLFARKGSLNHSQFITDVLGTLSSPEARAITEFDIPDQSYKLRALETKTICTLVAPVDLGMHTWLARPEDFINKFDVNQIVGPDGNALNARIQSLDEHERGLSSFLRQGMRKGPQDWNGHGRVVLCPKPC